MAEPSSSTSLCNSFIDNSEIPGDGAKKSLHGMDFQLKILMHVLWRAQKIGYKKFRLTTELPHAGKFDDVIFQYYEGDICKNRLIQIKHKEGKNLNALDIRALLSEKSSEPFSLFKYFKSLIIIEDRCKNGSIYSPFYNTEVEVVCLITNSDLSAVNEDEKLKDLFSEDEKSLKDDPLFRINDEHGDGNSKHSAVKYTINGKSDLAKKFISISNMNNMNFYNLVNDLASDISKKEVTKSTKFLEMFKHSLKGKVFTSDGIPEGFIKFTNDFIQGKNLIEETKSLRTALLEQMPMKRKYGGSLANENLNVQLKISNKLYSEFRTEDGSTLEALEKFSEQLCLKFNPDGRCISIVKPQTEDKTNDDWKVFEKNLHLLNKKHVIVSVFSKLRFSSRFIQGKHLDNDLLQFRKKLMSDLQKVPDLNIKEELDLKNYTFNVIIDDFRCSDEESILKPFPRPHTQDDFDNFFKKFKLIVKYPNRFEINILLEERMRTQLRSLDIDVSKSLFQEKLFSWMSERMCTFYTPEKMERLYNVITKSLHWMEGVNQTYFAAIPKKYSFNTSEKLLCQFLNSETENTLSLYYEYSVLGRIRFYQTFQKLSLENEKKYQKYTYMFGHIFLYASRLQDTKFQDTVAEALKDQKLWNLIVIDCDIEDISSISKWFMDIRDDNRKFIFIYASRIRNSIENFDHKIENIDTNFMNLAETSRKNIFQDESVLLQGTEIKLKELLDSKSLEYIDAEILVKLVQSESIEIGQKLRFSKGYDPTDYIERSLEEHVTCSLHRFLDSRFMNQISSNLSIVDNLEKLVSDIPAICFDLSPQVCDCTAGEKVSEQQLAQSLQNFILSDVAGMGKSTFISSLSNRIRKLHSNVWVIRIDFNEYTSFFNRKMNDEQLVQKLQENSNSFTIDFLIELLMSKEDSKLATKFEEKLLKSVLKMTFDSKANEEIAKLRVALLFDGFDEISPTYQDSSLALLQGIKKCRLAVLVVTTRPCCTKDLEELDIGKVMKLAGLTDEEKYFFIKKLLVENIFGRNKPTYFSLKNDLRYFERKEVLLFSYPKEMDDSGFYQLLTRDKFTLKVLPCNSKWFKNNFKCAFADYILITHFDDLEQTDQDMMIDFFNTEFLTKKKQKMVLTNRCFEKEADKKISYTSLRVEIPAKLDMPGSSTDNVTKNTLNVLEVDFWLYRFLKSLIRGGCDSTNSFHSTPLFCKILYFNTKQRQNASDSKSLLDDIRTDLWNGPDEINDLDLYSNCIKEMHSIYWHDKMRQNPCNEAAIAEKPNSLKLFIEKYQKLAIYALFFNEKKWLKVMLTQFGSYENVLKEIEEHIKQIELGREKGGLVNGILDGRPDFIHRSLAEYLIADFIADVLSSKQLNADFQEIMKVCILRNNGHVNMNNYRIFGNETFKLLTHSIKINISKISANVSNQFENRLAPSTSRDMKWILEEETETFFTALSFYPQFSTLIKMYLDTVFTYLSNNSHKFEKIDIQRFVVDPSKSRESDEYLFKCVSIANMGVPVDKMPNFRIPKDEDERRLYLQGMRACIGMLGNRFKSTERSWTLTAYRAACCAWGLESPVFFSVNYSLIGGTLLHVASKRGYMQLLRWLLHLGYPINLKNENGETPLDYLTKEHLAWLEEKKVVDSRLLTNSAFYESMKSNPQECPAHLALEGLKQDSFDLLVFNPRELLRE